VAELNEYWLFIPITGQSGNITRRYRYNYITGQVYKDKVTNLTTIGLAPIFEASVIDSVPDIIDNLDTLIDRVGTRRFTPSLVLGDNGGQAYRFDYDELNENGIAIDGFWDSKDYYGNPGYYSLWLGLDVECFGAEGGTLTVSYSTDEGTTWTDFSNTITLTAAISNHTLYCDVMSEKIRLRFRNNNISETFTLRGFHLHQPILRESIN